MTYSALSIEWIHFGAPSIPPEEEPEDYCVAHAVYVISYLADLGHFYIENSSYRAVAR